MSTPNRRRGSEAATVWLVIGLIVAALVVFYAGYVGGAFISGVQVLTWHPVAALAGLVKGTTPWSVASTVISSVVFAALAGAVFTLSGSKLFARTPQARVDKAAAYMGRGADIAFMKEKQATAEAKRLGVDSPGLPIARTVSGSDVLYSSWENVCVDIWGPRTGKTTSRAIPGICAAPGAVLVTSNKRDVVDATRGVREDTGKVWVFDPQHIAGEEPTWWWNPLSYVSDEVKARNLAEHFASGSRDRDAKTDAFFDPAAKDLLAGLLLGAALGGYPITRVYEWLSRENDDEAVGLLRMDGYEQIALNLEGVIYAPERQRAGVYGVARQMATCLTNRKILEWITPHTGRAEFHPYDFVQGKNTLYSLSKEGQGTAGPLVTALTVATVEVAEELAVSLGGRLNTPLVAMLDEAANVCRWAQLPDLYSHYGSRGIVINTILQSWSQGVGVWGREGMSKLWSAANVKVYGGGVTETAFLEDLAKLIGDYTYTTSSRSYSRQGSSRSVDNDRKDRILEVADLQALPRGRAVVMVSGAPAVLCETIPWYTNTTYKGMVAASLKKYDPAQKVVG